MINNYVDDIGNENALFILSNDTDIIFAGNYYKDMSYRMANANFVASFVMMGNKGEGDWQYGWRYAQVLGATYYSYANRMHFPGQFFASCAQTTGWDMDEDGDGVPDFMEEQGILLTNKKIIYTITESDELDSNGRPQGYDSDDDGLSDGAELGTMYTLECREEDGEIVKSIFPNNNFREIWARNIADFFPEGVGTTYVFAYLSDPNLEDTDGDGINDDEDTAPMAKGLAGGVIGKLFLVSCYDYEDAGWYAGHAFFVYTSYINDNVDLSTLENGWSKIDSDINWSKDNITKDASPLGNYTFKVGESVTIGNGAFGKGSGSGDVSGSDGDSSWEFGTEDEANGVAYNMEVAKYVWYEIDYLANTYICEDITEDDLEELISYCSKDSVSYWTLTHNCAEVACNAWNLISDVKVSAKNKSFYLGAFATPKGLKINLRTLSNSAEDYSLADALNK